MVRARSRSPTLIAASRRSPSTLNRPGWRVPLASARVAAMVSSSSASAVVAQGQRDEPEDVAVVDLERQVASLDGQLEPLAGEPLGLVRPAVVRGDQRHATQSPRREQFGSFARVALKAAASAFARAAAQSPRKTWRPDSITS